MLNTNILILNISGGNILKFSFLSSDLQKCVVSSELDANYAQVLVILSRTPRTRLSISKLIVLRKIDLKLESMIF